MKTKTKKTRTAPKKVSKTATTIAFVLDRSGSMASTKQETISGFNEYIKTLQKGKDSGKATFTMVQFDSQGIDTLYDKSPIKNIQPLNNETFVPRSWTPLYDAVGQTINRILKQTEKKENVLFTILTDGQENASKEYDLNGVKKLMKECEEDRDWTFAFIGMSQEGWDAADRMAMGTQSVNNVFKISRDPKDIKRSYARAGGQTVCYAAACAIGSDTTISSMKANFWGKGKDDDDNG